LPERDVREFYAAATRFANDKLWGSLAAVVIAPKSVLAEPSSRAALERSVNDLEYGTVSVNAWSGMPFGLSELPWGGAPGGTLLDARSGVGFSHNGLMLEGVKKSIVRAPLAAFPTPFWYANHRSLRRFGRAFLDYEMKPNALRLASIARAAMAG
jgi:aldehyde dehydrogenase (NAD(P)+)